MHYLVCSIEDSWQARQTATSKSPVTATKGKIRQPTKIMDWLVKTLFRHIHKIAKSNYQLRHVCLSIHPHVTTWLPLHRFSLNLIWGFSKIYQENSSFIKTWQSNRYFTWRPCIFTISRSILLTVRNVSDKTCRENQNTYYMFNNCFLRIVPYIR
jgi:hypothetical protein